MKYSVEKPGAPAELVHHGVKGMHWGIRKEEESGGGVRDRAAALGKKYMDASRAHDAKTKARLGIDNSDATKAYLSVLNKMPKNSLGEAKANLKVNQEKFAQKFGPSTENSDDKHGLTPTQKELLIGAAVGVGAAGALYYLHKSGADNSFNLVKHPELSLEKLTTSELRAMSGKPISPGAIVDEMDAGVIGETPLVLFKTSAVTKKLAEPLTPAMVHAAETNLTEIMNRKL